jgi:hypothetical protein
MNRLSPNDFLDQIRNAPAWRLTFDNVTGEVEITVWVNPGDTDKPTVFNGPDPCMMNGREYDRFIAAVEAFSSPRMKRASIMGRLRDESHPGKP